MNNFHWCRKYKIRYNRMANLYKRVLIVGCLLIVISYAVPRYFSLPNGKFRYRNPEKSDMENLSEQQMEIEKLTFPLPESEVFKDEVFLLISVFSQPENTERRNLIRTTWGNTYVKDFDKVKNPKPFHYGRTYKLADVVKTVFVLAQSKNKSVMKAVLQEANYYNDIILGSHEEDYKNNTLKLKLALKSAYYNCKGTFFMKMDDDSFANPVVLVEWLKEKPSYNLYAGYTHFGGGVQRDNNSKWYIGYEHYNKSEKLPAFIGNSYVVSEDVLGEIVKMLYGRIFPLEDVLVGVLLEEGMPDVKPVHAEEHFNVYYDGKSTGCQLNKLFLAHQVLGEDQTKHIKIAREALVSCND